VSRGLPFPFRFCMLPDAASAFLGCARAHVVESAFDPRVRETLEACMPGVGYCLGSGDSVANYVPADAYLAMLDEPRRFSP